MTTPAGKRTHRSIVGHKPKPPNPTMTAGVASLSEAERKTACLCPPPLARHARLRCFTWQAISGLFGSCTHSGPGVNRRPVKIVPAVGVNAAPARASWDQAEGDPMVGTVRHHFRCAATPTSATAGTQLPTTQPVREDNAQ
jgi:hypothetical protein